MRDWLVKNKFTQNPADHCVYAKEKNGGKVIIIIAASREKILSNVKKTLAEKFKMKDLGKLRYFLGIHFNQSNGCITILQENYINKVQQRINMHNYGTRKTPFDQKLEYTGQRKFVTSACRGRLKEASYTCSPVPDQT